MERLPAPVRLWFQQTGRGARSRRAGRPAKAKNSIARVCTTRSNSVNQSTRMKLTILSAASIACLSLVAPVQAQTSSLESTLRGLDAEWSAAAASKNLDKTVSYYSDDAVVLAPNTAVLTTKEGIRGIWKGLLSDPSAAVSWKATRVEIAKSGDMAYISGTYELTINGPDGKPVNDRGKYLEVWEKQPDGKWKCGADAWNTDLPAPTQPVP